ncbi:MAG TPA: hypothetical protein VGO92_12535 [Acidimicrobiales bacterium]|nr:hypothetical protein [Acidimicrobiales bacterium]
MADGPSPEQLAAIVAAVEMAWPRPVVPAQQAAEPLRWRFSGRWWVRPIPSRRDRPW